LNVSNGTFVFLPAFHHASTHTREISETASTIFSLCPMSTGSNANNLLWLVKTMEPGLCTWPRKPAQQHNPHTH